MRTTFLKSNLKPCAGLKNFLKDYFLRSPFLVSFNWRAWMKCRSVIEVRDGLTFLDLIVIQIEVNLDCPSFAWFLCFPCLYGLFTYKFIQHSLCRISIPNMEAMFLCFWWIHSTLMMTLKRYLSFIFYSFCRVEL